MRKLSAKLLPCPFCGGEAVLEGDNGYPGFYVICTNVDCYAVLGEHYDRDGCGDHYFQDPESATEAWNRRAP